MAEASQAESSPVTVTGKFREITGEELDTAIDEGRKLVYFNQVKSWAQEHYGPEAHRVSIDFGSEYNDEGGSYTTVDGIAVYNKQGDELDPINEDESTDDDSDDFDDFEVLDSFSNTVTYDEGSESDIVFDKPPEVKFPRLFVPA